MSFSKPRETTKNPASRFVDWKGGFDQGFFQYFDKEKGGKGENVKFDLGEFIVLDNDLFSITGYDEPNKSAIISNEVRTIEDTLIVKAWKDKQSKVVLQGPYSQIKQAVKDSRVFKYTRCVYLLHLETGLLIHLKMGGYGAYTVTNPEGSGNYGNNVLVVKEIKDGKKGAVQFKYPVFAFGREITKEEADKAFEMDSNVLQPYLEKYLAKGSDSASSSDPATSDFNPEEWRSFKCKDKPLCEYSRAQIEHIKEELIENNDVDSDLFMAVDAAVSDYRKAELTWRDKKDKAGKKLEDYELSEIQKILAATSHEHPIRIILEVAVDELAAEAGFEEDDIPF
jgi:hypothetical protein